MSKLNLAIIGMGTMGKIRKHCCVRNANISLVGYYDSIDAGEYGLPKLMSIDEIANNSNINAVIVCTPNNLNAPITQMMLEHGKHVFCEKPPALTVAEMNSVIEKQRRHNKVLHYGFNHRRHKSIQYIKNLLESNEFGKILWMRGRYGKSVTKSFFSNWRSQKSIVGGGILFDQGIHMLDLFLYLGGGFDYAKANLSNLYWHGKGVEDNAFVILRNSHSGCVASLHSTMTQWRHLFSLEIFLEKGYMTLNGLKTTSNSYGKEVLTYALNRSKSPAATWDNEKSISYSDDSFWQVEIDDFAADCIELARNPDDSHCQSALQLMKTLQAIYRDSEQQEGTKI